MKTLCIVALTLIALPAFADSQLMKPGLWEMKTTRQVIDGKDMTSMLTAAQSRMQAAMATMSAEQRAQMETMMQKQGLGGQAASMLAPKVCVSEAMAANNRMIMDPGSHCEPVTLTRVGNKVTYPIKCMMNGATAVGQAETIIDGDRFKTSMDLTTNSSQGGHTLHGESEGTWLGADCKGTVPLDQQPAQP